MDVIRIDGDFCPADVRVVELVDSLHSQVASIEAENAELRERIKALVNAAEAYRALNVCYRIGTSPSENLFAELKKADAALAGGKEE